MKAESIENRMQNTGYYRRSCALSKLLHGLTIHEISLSSLDTWDKTLRWVSAFSLKPYCQCDRKGVMN